MITCSIRMRFDGRCREEAVQVLRGLLGPVRSERGCRNTRLLQETGGDGDTVSWISCWQERRHLEKHLRSRHFRRILAIMELAAEKPDIVFELGDERRGLDLVEEVIGGDGGHRGTQLAWREQDPNEGENLS